MTGATDELRRMLDERGVEYRFNDATKVFEWHFDGTDGEGSAHATEVNGGVNIMACSLTPEQAIAATLGQGECRVMPHSDGSAYPLVRFCEGVCSECGEEFPTGYNFCPNCGRRVVE